MAQIEDVSSDNLLTYLSQTGVPSYYLTILTSPQICLVFFNKAKNRLLTLLKTQLTVLDSLSNALLYIKNTENPITSSMTDLKVPLLQFDSSGSLKNLETYTDQVLGFLSKLSIKSGSSQSFGQTSVDSQEDVFTGLQAFLTIQKDVDMLVKNLSSFEDQLKNVSLSKTISRNLSNFTRSQIDNLDQQKNDISRISIASDLLASTSVMSYFKSFGELFPGVYSPLVSSSIPANEEVYGYPEQVSAVATSLPYPRTVTHTSFDVSIDGTSYSVDFPSTAAKGRAYLLATQAAASYTILPNTRLYVKVTCPTLPNPVVLTEGVTTPDGVIAVDLPAGVQTIASIKTAITNGLNVADTSAVVTQFAVCDEFSHAGSNRLMIYGKSDVTKIEIVPPPGNWNNGTGTYTQAKDSENSALFLQYGASQPINMPLYKDLADCLNYVFPIELLGNTLQIASPSTGSGSSISFTSSISTDLGFTNQIPKPSFINLKSNGQILNPVSLGLYDGCFYKDSTGNKGSITIQGQNIIPPAIPNMEKIILEIYPDLTFLVQTSLKLLQGVTFYTNQFSTIWLPILNNPSSQQVTSAKNYSNQVKSTINDLIASLTQTVKNSPLVDNTNVLMSQLETQGLTKLVTNLNDFDLSSFFAAQMNDTSFGLDTMSKMEALNG